MIPYTILQHTCFYSGLLISWCHWGTKISITHPKINLSIWKCKDKEGFGVRKRINTTVKSTYQSLIHVECSVLYFSFMTIFCDINTNESSVKPYLYELNTIGFELHKLKCPSCSQTDTEQADPDFCITKPHNTDLTLTCKEWRGKSQQTKNLLMESSTLYLLLLGFVCMFLFSTSSSTPRLYPRRV